MLKLVFCLLEAKVHSIPGEYFFFGGGGFVKVEACCGGTFRSCMVISRKHFQLVELL